MRPRAIKTILAASLVAGVGVTAAGSFWPRAAPALDNFERYVFVPSRAAPEVTVIDSRADRVVATLELAAAPGQIVVSKAVGALVASDPRSRTLALVDLATRQIDTVIRLDIRPDYLQLSPDGYLIAIGDSAGGAVSVVSLHKRRGLFRIDGFSRPAHLTFNIDGSMIYVAELGADRVSVIDVSLQKVIERIATANFAPDGEISLFDVQPTNTRGVTNVTRAPNGRFGFATLTDGDQLAVLDLDDSKPVKTLPLGKQPWRAFATADGRFMMVPNNGDKTVTVIDTASLDVAATLPGAADVAAIDTGWFESVAYVISRSENKAVVLDLMELRKAGEIPLPSSPGPGVVIPDGTKLYVALGDSNQVAVIDTRRGRLIKTIDHVGARPWGATMGHSNNYCH